MSKTIKYVECAHCGEVVGAYYVTCPYCGYKLADNWHGPAVWHDRRRILPRAREHVMAEQGRKRD